ncbi:helix-turn-helix domain-containing protein [Leptotrichia sp. oral taxon 212]|uniref:helix-turn-helix domain-containing protein n=1 Tax=Leptotrichia sp. oral taxon 212 TaxID=712357 RepID=UPI0006A9DF25|nr:helix-turn-helix transcriptional regulator [Leptotrichia sp. oral taxon 212]
MKSTGEILEKYIRRKISQVELSKLIGVSPQYISNIINDLKGPSENFLDKFYKIFDVSAEDKKKISEYEELRKLPKKIQEEITLFRKDETVQEKNHKLPISNIVLDGQILPNNEIYFFNQKEIQVFPKFDENDEELFSIIIKSNDYEPKFHYLDTLIFSRQKKINFEELHKKYCLVEYENKKYIKNIEYINDIIILKALNGKEETMVFPKGTYYNLRILGVLKGCLQKY